MFKLAGHLKMTVRELSERMDSEELSEWMAYHYYYEQIPDLNRSIAILTTAVVAGYARRGNVPDPKKFMGMGVAPTHPIQDEEVIIQMAQELGLEHDGDFARFIPTSNGEHERDRGGSGQS